MGGEMREGEREEERKRWRCEAGETGGENERRERERLSQTGNQRR